MSQRRAQIARRVGVGIGVQHHGKIVRVRGGDEIRQVGQRAASGEIGEMMKPMMILFLFIVFVASHADESVQYITKEQYFYSHLIRSTSTTVMQCRHQYWITLSIT
jgi:hypothetical protein